MGRDKGVKQTDTARGREGAKTEKQGERKKGASGRERAPSQNTETTPKGC